MGETVVIGVGNEYRRDDGVGPLVLSLLEGRLPPGARLARCPDGEPGDLVSTWENAERVIIVDAIRVPGGHAGRVHRVVVGADPVFAPETTGGTHGLGLGTAVEFARALDRLPRTLIVYAVEGGHYGMGAGVGPEVARAAEEVASGIIAELAGS